MTPHEFFLRLPAKYAGQNAVMTPPCSLLKKTQIKKTMFIIMLLLKKKMSVTFHSSRIQQKKKIN